MNASAIAAGNTSSDTFGDSFSSEEKPWAGADQGNGRGGLRRMAHASVSAEGQRTKPITSQRRPKIKMHPGFFSGAISVAATELTNSYQSAIEVYFGNTNFTHKYQAAFFEKCGRKTKEHCSVTRYFIYDNIADRVNVTENVD